MLLGPFLKGQCYVMMCLLLNSGGCLVLGSPCNGDEPFSPYDSISRGDCIDWAKHFMASNSIAALVVSHNPDDAVGLNATEIILPL